MELDEYGELEKEEKKLDYNSMSIEKKLEFLLKKEDLNIELIKELLKNKDHYNFSTDITKTSQGVDQIKTLKREIKYNKNEPLKIKEMAFSNYKKSEKNQELYETIYDENGNQEIIYYEKNTKTVLAIIEIDKDGKLKLKETLSYNLNKINEILNDDYKSINGFDDKLSFLSYIPLMNTKNIIFKTNCKSTENIVDIIKDSKNKDEIFVCDFGYDEHRVQVVINKCNATILNTGHNFENVKKNIEEKCKGQNIKIEHISTIDQIDGNCAEASKLYTIVLAMKYKEEFKTLENFSERLNNFQKFMENILGKKKEEQKDDLKTFNKKENSEMLKIVLKTNVELLNNYKKHFNKMDEELKRFYKTIKNLDENNEENKIIDNEIEEKYKIADIIVFGHEIKEMCKKSKGNGKYKNVIDYIIKNIEKNSEKISKKEKISKIEVLKKSKILLKIIKYNVQEENLQLRNEKIKQITGISEDKKIEHINKLLEGEKNKKMIQIFQECIEKISNLSPNELEL